VVCRRESVLVEVERSPAGLSDDQVRHPRVTEVGGDDRPTVTVVVGAADVADVEEVAAADVEVHPLPLEGAEVVALGEDAPRVPDPELVELPVQCAGLCDLTIPLAGL
jgi:hypothetical protein